MIAGPSVDFSIEEQSTTWGLVGQTRARNAQGAEKILTPQPQGIRVGFVKFVLGENPLDLKRQKG
jgi:hypothetical protein